MKLSWFAGKKVFITGGSSGIGKAAAVMLAKNRASVFIAARGQDRLDAALAEVKAAARGAGQVFDAFAIDVSDKEAVREMAPKVIDGLGGLDVLINNAGITHPAALLETPDDVFDAMMDVNYFGVVHATRAFLPHFASQKRGHICNVASMLGFMGIYGYSAYAASKFAVTGFTECLRQELIEHNVEVSVLFPPDTDTPQFHEENKIKPAETKAIAGNVKVMSAEAVAATMLDGIARHRYHILPGNGSKFAYFMYRHFPHVVRWVIDSDLKKHLKKSKRMPG